jgi:hypothetical protein
MVEIEATLFDALKDGAAPTEMFGAVLTGAAHSLALARLGTLASTAHAGVADTFRRSISSDAAGVRGLDDTIRGMWADGWSPQAGNIGLFTAHFGALFSQALLGVTGSVAVFRSTDTLDHFSVWSPTLLLEVFPFHKTHKALIHREGESLFQVYAQFVRHSAA